MVNRIQEIIKYYGLTPARFADELQVPRSTISHLLSGRNNPSLDFINKILHHYPEISTEWLIKGKGNMSGNSMDLFSDFEQPVEEKVFDNPIEKKDDGSALPAENKISKEITRDRANDENLTEEKQLTDRPKCAEIQNNKTTKKESNNRLKIVRIITFYEDNSFEEFYPVNG